MRKNIWLIISLSIVSVMIVSACGSAQTPALPQEPAATDAPAGGEEIAPESEVQSAAGEDAAASGGAYPAVAQPIEFVQPDPYPTPVQAENINWMEMANFIQSNDVVQVLQTPTKMIVITMADGTLYTTTEPEKEDIFKLLNECGQPCNTIRRLSEW